MHDALKPGIANLKLAELNALAHQIAQLQNEVATRQAIIDSLAARAENFRALLAKADSTRSTALANLNLAQAAGTASAALENSSVSARNHAREVNTRMGQLAANETVLAQRLVFVASLLDKACQLASKQKAGNPHIPDALSKLLNQAGSDSANVIAQTLSAQDSCLLAAAGTVEAAASLNLAQGQAKTLRQLVQEQDGVLPSLDAIYQSAVAQYHATLAASSNANMQLDHATATLANAKARLASLQAGLAAANAGTAAAGAAAA